MEKMTNNEYVTQTDGTTGFTNINKMGGVKIAYLISAYKDPKQLARLIKRLGQGDATHFFIHADAKCVQERFEEALTPCKGNVTFTPKRFWGQWGGFNQVRYQQELLRACLECGKTFDRVFILTGQDYPLISNEEINKRLLEKPEREYLKGLDITKLAYLPKTADRIVLYHFFRDMNHASYKTKKIFSGLARLAMKALPIRKKPYLIVEGKKWDVYLSSSYMCITSGLARHVYNIMASNKKLMSYFKHSFVPEEMVIPTIVFNSPYKKFCEVYEKNSYDGLSKLSAVTYFNYGCEIQTFTLKDYEELKQSGKMFARKFASGASDSLMDKLDKEHGL